MKAYSNRNCVYLLIIIYIISTVQISKSEKTLQPLYPIEDLEENCVGRDGETMEITEKLYDFLKGQKFLTIDLKDKTKKKSNVDEYDTFHTRRVREEIIVRKKIQEIILTDGNEEFKNKAIEDGKNSLSRIDELSNLLKKPPKKAKKVHKPWPKQRIHVKTLQQFFNYLIRGFNQIKGRKELVQIIGQKAPFIMQENFNGYFVCKENNSSIDYAEFLELKDLIGDIDHAKYKKTMKIVADQINKIIMLIGKNCDGLNNIMEFISTFICNIEDKDTRPDLLLNITRLKDLAFTEIDKHSFNEAGFTLGKIFGEARKYTFYIKKKLVKPIIPIEDRLKILVKNKKIKL